MSHPLHNLLLAGSGLLAAFPAAAQPAVFVRMRDQLLPRAGALEAFHEAHAKEPRRTLRARVIEDLRRRAERSFAKVAPLVARLEREGHLRDVRRRWIVNGFAARADAVAQDALAAHEAVAAVQRQTLPPALSGLGPRRRLREPERARADLERALELAERGDEARFSAEGLEIPWNLRRIRADRAWAEGATGEGVVVALMDSGLLVTPALCEALWRNPREELNGEDDDGNGYVDDLFGWDFTTGTPYCVGDRGVPHGSMCAGIVAGRPFGERRVVTGVAPRARIMVLRGSGYLEAYEYALANGADVVSMSYMWVGRELGDYRGIYRCAHEHLDAAGVLAVGGAGNFARTAPPGRQIALPKDIPCVVAAAGILENGEKAPPSSEGPCTWDIAFYDDHPPERPLRKPDVTAPFGGFPVWGGSARLRRGWRVVGDAGDGAALIVGPRGNSFAGPHAAGVAALVLSVAPDLKPYEVKRILEDTARDLGPEGPDTTFGAGLLQADAAVRAARER